ncbi:dynamin family protein [Colletotrichum tofieldiae]|nr:dynamin family protein [Colletotrichum tofieldiae]GKT74286.1 dynamin family protein [Colletotrichum tofieldiae]
MAQIALDSTALDELNSVETRTLFDTADKLSSLGVGRIVNLPQIIVVGDQSSGKSSVLEAISHVHFPVQGGVCTRFATELVLRPGSRRSVTASVQFADSTRPAHSLQVTDFNQDDIDKIISDAKEKMGLSDAGRSFSKDVLRLEIEGPDMYPLTLVDLPGIFHTATAKQSAEGKATVMELVESYMKKPNSIILAIISANNQLANQVVMQEAAKHDPTKTRTLGVITKPDLLHPGSSNEHEYLQVVRGREAVHNLGLGWHVLRNRADYEKDLGPRDTVEEQFFKSGAWGSIPGTNRGVAALRVKLSHILHDHIKRSLPTVIEDIQDKLFERGNELDRLGSPRTTPEDMRAYLIDIAGNFQRLVHDGIRGHYNDPFFGGFDGTHRKLRSKLRNFNRAIRHVLLTYGSAQEVVDRHYGTQRQLTPPDYLSELVETYADGLPNPEVVTWAQLSAELEAQAAANQGTEFPGYANMSIVIQLFQKQAEPWQLIAELHLEKVTDVVKAFVDEAFEHIVGPPSSSSTTAAILSTSVDDFFEEKEQVLSAKLKELLRPFKEGYALPLDADFHEAMEKAAAERAAAQVEGGSDLEQHVEIAMLSQRSNDFGTERIVDTMETFYDSFQMALRTFTDNLINLAIESCLVQDLPSLFTPRLVSSMDDEKLAELAAESEEVRNYRSQLQEDIKLLKQGLEQCRRYRPRAGASGSFECPAGDRIVWEFSVWIRLLETSSWVDNPVSHW